MKPILSLAVAALILSVWTATLPAQQGEGVLPVVLVNPPLGGGGNETTGHVRLLTSKLGQGLSITSTGTLNVAGGVGAAGLTTNTYIIWGSTGQLKNSQLVQAAGGTHITASALFEFGNGTAPAPSIALKSSPGTGFYRIGADIIGLATAGSERVRVDAGGITSTVLLNQPDGAVTLPSYGFTNSPTSGFYRVGTNIVGLATAGVQAMRWDASQNGIFKGDIYPDANNSSNVGISGNAVKSVGLSYFTNSNAYKGQLYLNGDQACLSQMLGNAITGNGITVTYPGILFTATANVPVYNSASEITLTSGTGVGGLALSGMNIPAGFGVAGKTIEIEGGGIYSSAVSPGTLLLSLKLGGATIAATAATAPPPSATGIQSFRFKDTLTWRTTTSVVSVGSTSFATPTGGYDIVRSRVTATAVTVGTGALVLSETAKWSAAQEPDGITLTACTIKALN